MLIILNLSKIYGNVSSILVILFLNIELMFATILLVFFFLMKESYNGKYTELNFLQNLALRPKDEMQSAHFFGITVHSPLLFVPDIIFL